MSDVESCRVGDNFCPITPIPDTFVKNHNLGHKPTSNLHYEYKQTTQYVSLYRPASGQIKQSVQQDMKPYRRYKPINILRIQFSPSPLLQYYYHDICPRYRHYCRKIYRAGPITVVLPQITVHLSGWYRRSSLIYGPIYKNSRVINFFIIRSNSFK